MKKILLTITAVIFMSSFGFAQKYAFVDTDYILGNIPEYNDAQKILEDLSLKWQKEIEKKFEEIDQLYNKYQADAILLPEEMKQKREQEIIDKEKEVKNIQKRRFGQGGDLFKKRQELIKPIQEKIYNALEEIAEKGNYAFVFDKANNQSMLYTNAKYDISNEVLETMGYSY